MGKKIKTYLEYRFINNGFVRHNLLCLLFGHQPEKESWSHFCWACGKKLN